MEKRVALLIVLFLVPCVIAEQTAPSVAIQSPLLFEVIVLFFWPGFLFILSRLVKSMFVKKMSERQRKVFSKISLALLAAQFSWFIFLFVFSLLMHFQVAPPWGT